MDYITGEDRLSDKQKYFNKFIENWTKTDKVNLLKSIWPGCAITTLIFGLAAFIIATFSFPIWQLYTVACLFVGESVLFIISYPFISPSRVTFWSWLIIVLMFLPTLLVSILLEELIVIAMIMGLFVSLLTSILFTVKKGFRVAFYLLCLGLLVFLLQEANIYNFYYCLPALYIQLTDIIVFILTIFGGIYLLSFYQKAINRSLHSLLVKTDEIYKLKLNLDEEIEERKKIEIEKKAIHHFSEDNPHPVFSISYFGEILYANSAAERMLKLLKRSVGQIIPLEWIEVLKKVKATASPQKSKITFNGKHYVIYWTPIHNIEKVYLYVFDISDRIKIKKELLNTLNETKLRSRELDFIKSASDDLIAWQWQNVDQLYHQILVRANDFVEGIGGVLYIYDPEHDYLTFNVAVGSGYENSKVILRRGIEAPGRAWECGDAIISTKEDDEKKYQLTIPIKWREELLGVFSLNREKVFVERDRELMVKFVSHAAQAIQNARLVQITQDEINYRKTTELAMLESERRFKSLFDNAPVGIYRVNSDGFFQQANTKFAEILELNAPLDLIEKNISIKDLMTPADFEARNKQLKTYGEVKKMQSVWVTNKNKKIWVEENIVTIKKADDTIISYEGTVENIDERKKAEEKLNLADQILSHIGNIVLVVDKKAHVIYGTLAIEKTLGFPLLEIFKDGWYNFIYDNQNDIVNEKLYLKNAALGKTALKEKPYEQYIVDQSGKGHWILWQDTFGPRGFIVRIGSEITDRKIAEQQIFDSLKEKEELLKEIHHRVKNNMQIISSLLYLQSKDIKDEKINEMLLNSQNRIKTMALIHEKLYQSKDLTNIDFADYIKSLLISFIKYPNIKITSQVDSIRLPITKAIPCGLIVNELVTNAIKYAFPDDKKGNIIISLIEGEEHFTLTVRDDGIGMSKIDFSNIKTLGLTLVDSLTKQLNGHIETNSENGTSFQINFN